MAINLQKKSEGIHYEIIPDDESPAWLVRIIEGQFIETVIQFGSIAFNEIKDNMSFNFFIKTSPDPTITESNEELQIEAGEILEDIIANGILKGSIISRDIDKDNANKN